MYRQQEDKPEADFDRPDKTKNARFW